MPQVGLEPTISAGERRPTHALDCAVTGTGILFLIMVSNSSFVLIPHAPSPSFAGITQHYEHLNVSSTAVYSDYPHCAHSDAETSLGLTAGNRQSEIWSSVRSINTTRRTPTTIRRSSNKLQDQRLTIQGKGFHVHVTKA